MTAPAPAFIFARGGSKGVPRKNLRLLAGRPLLAHAIAAARAAKGIDKVIVSTDDDEIAASARSWGAETPFRRPAELALDDSSEWLAWQHAIGEMTQAGERPGIFVSVPTTAPLRHPADIEACIEKLQTSGADIVITVTPASRNPYFNMVVLDGRDGARLVIPPERGLARRQDAPTVFDMTTVCYVARTDFVMTAGSVFDGRVAAVVVPQERALDIDTELDLRVAACLLPGTAA